MSLLAIIAALSLEQFFPLKSRARLSDGIQRYLRFFRRHFNAGEHQHGKIAWLLAVLPGWAAVTLMHILLADMLPFLAWAFDVVMLYLIMGFHSHSVQFLAIQRALRDDRVDEAERQLSAWRGVHHHGAQAEEIARLSIEQALLVAQHRVFGVILWFVLFSAVGMVGSAGALIYRLALHLRDGWDDEQHSEPFSHFARQACFVMTWLPVRLCAISYAIVGNFEDTLYCWRSQAHHWLDAEEGVLLASAAGSLGVRLGMDVVQGAQVVQRPELGLGDDADPAAMQSATGLVWRTLVVWLIVMLLLNLADLLP